MTLQEHQLMVGLLAKQLQTIKTLTTILESRGILEKDDLAAFHSLTADNRQVTDDLIDHAAKIYRTIGVPLGLDIPADLV